MQIILKTIQILICAVAFVLFCRFIFKEEQQIQMDIEEQQMRDIRNIVEQTFLHPMR